MQNSFGQTSSLQSRIEEHFAANWTRNSYIYIPNFTKIGFRERGSSGDPLLDV
jgi:hypothetical protein